MIRPSPAGPKCSIVRRITQTSIASAAAAIQSATVALSRMPTTFNIARSRMPAQANATTWCSKKGNTLPT
jgi:hypothetical protein